MHPSSAELKAYYRTDVWKKLSRECRMRDGWKCRACGKPRNDSKWWRFWERRIYLVVHHESYEQYRRKPGSEPLIDLVTLCQVHHREAHDRYRSGKYRTLRQATVATIAAHAKGRADP